MPGINYVSSSLNRTKRKWSAQADEEAYPRLPHGYVRRKPRGMFAYLKPPPPLLREENDEVYKDAEGQTQEEELELPWPSQKNERQEDSRQPTPRKPTIQPKVNTQPIDFGFSWAVPLNPAQQRVKEPFGNSGKLNNSREDRLPSAHRLPWFMAWENTWPKKADSQSREREEKPQHCYSAMFTYAISLQKTKENRI
ncbi:hypothetical protein I307_00394 [Cryptococcus deuterogattii 99/473]|uniref:Uncharacterized protein n=1 Tax=Cryptococcus deuterogattii Ram5 TaxID=1296110 RepID=A0A0D0V3D4_9TREE|nr:hypothetical protein I313_02098 [Cryptococcus deuterogattii Ram5]KIR73239.1 hypothetical protein I310_02903 [Cryptococcus deuterogattii CA1014]KIR98995.1 hypothetical protein L804_03615 [Cryptococcus deuterogattii 2001/935-1]KIY59950.1 hypothetical protein I307_00394 [Cryptococcus deuterogattii 99/473]